MSGGEEFPGELRGPDPVGYLVPPRKMTQFPLAQETLSADTLAEIVDILDAFEPVGTPRFAWYPVRLRETRRWAWLRFVERHDRCAMFPPYLRVTRVRWFT